MSTATSDDDRSDPMARLLVQAGWLFAAGTAIHTIDHLRRGQGSVTESLYLLGNVGLVLQVVTITLILTRHRLAPLVALSAGIPLALGYMGAHWLPQWGALSDPLWEIDSYQWFSWLASTMEIAGALAIAVAGASIVRARGLESFATR